MAEIKAPARKAAEAEYRKRWNAAHPGYYDEYRKKNSDRLVAYGKQYRLDHPRPARPPLTEAEKAARAEKRRKDYIANWPKRRENAARYYAANKDAIQRRVQDDRKVNPGKYRNYRHKSTYGLAPGQFEAMWEAQGSCCAICRAELTHGLTTHIDHNHATGLVRGLLCSKCNTSLWILDDQSMRQRALEYVLEKASCQ